MTLIIVSAHDQSLFDTLTLGDMSVEVVSILVCSIGLVVAIPLTTGLGVLVVRSGLRPTRQSGSGHGSGSASAPDPGGGGGGRGEAGRPATRRERLLGERTCGGPGTSWGGGRAAVSVGRGRAQSFVQASVSTPRMICSISSNSHWPTVSGGESWMTGSPR